MRVFSSHLHLNWQPVRSLIKTIIFDTYGFEVLHSSSFRRHERSPLLLLAVLLMFWQLDDNNNILPAAFLLSAIWSWPCL